MSFDPDDVVRRLLADARPDEPVPAEVAERLDLTLAHLERQRSAPERARQAAELAGRRRRTRTTAWLLAAAAVVVAAGVGLSHLDPHLLSSTDAGSAGSTADRGVAGAQPNRPGPLPVIRPGHLREDVVRRAPVPAAGSPAEVDAGSLSCVPPKQGQEALRVTYRMRLAALVYDAPRGGQRRVTLYTCDGVHGGTRVAAVTIPAG